MSEPGILSDGEQTAMLAEVMDALSRSASLPGGAAREDLDRRLILALEQLDHPLPKMISPIQEPPPRPVALAMALTLFSQPHLIATFGKPQTEPQGRGVSRPTVINPDVLTDLLGLPMWELEEMQGEVDRRVSLHLKQHRALSWLWSHFGLPSEGVAALVEVLLPGLRESTVGTVGLSRRGGQLYALVDQPRGVRPAALYLGWLDRDVEGAVPPRGTFSARYVDRSLQRRLARSIGADIHEVLSLLDRVVTVVPRQSAPAFLAADRWRSLAYDAVSGLAGGYPRSADLAAALTPESVSFEGWLRKGPEGVQIDNGKALFDSLALDRAGEVARQLQAHNVATVLALGDDCKRHQLDELVRYDVQRHLRTALEPLLDWTRGVGTAEHVARRLGVERDAADEALARLHQTWRLHMDTTWCGGIEAGRPASVAARLTAQLVRTRHSLANLWERRPALDQEHREAALLFAAHYFAESSLDRLWGRDQGDLAEDPVGRWFWPTWVAVLGTYEQDSVTESTLSF